MTNPGAAIKLLITYAICVPAAIFVGFLLTNPLDYGTLGFLGLVLALIFSPIFIKWHYPIMVFGIGAPMYMFFLKGNPPMMQVVVILSLGIAIVERAMSSDRRFISVPSMTWPLMFTVLMAYITAELTGGIGLHTLGGAVGGGKKYLALFIGVAMFFALTSRPIPKEQRRLYLGLFFLSLLPSFISDAFPFLPEPLNYINLLIPPSSMATTGFSFGETRMGAFANSAGAVVFFMLAKFGLRGIFLGNRLWRIPVFLLMLVLTLFGGFRGLLITYAFIITALFFIEGLHRTRLMLLFVIGMAMGGALLVPFSNKLPHTFQRAMSFLPLNWDTDVKMDAEGSITWRENIWRAAWPQVPNYLLLGKGYALREDDFAMMGVQGIDGGQFAGGIASQIDATQEGLAISSDYHNGPLSTLMPFGIWGGISILWLMAAGLRLLHLNHKYGDPELATVNAFLLVLFIFHIFNFFFIFGAYTGDVSDIAKYAGFSVALNWGVRGPARPASEPVTFKPPAQLQRQPQLA